MEYLGFKNLSVVIKLAEIFMNLRMQQLHSNHVIEVSFKIHFILIIRTMLILGLMHYFLHFCANSSRKIFSIKREMIVAKKKPPHSLVFLSKLKNVFICMQ